MATLVLTTIGTVIGGPIGGAIGAVLGQQVDQRLLAPRRQGARLGALTVQTSAYGQPIPRLFGTLRVAGTVIWATDLREEKNRSGGGKGRPKATTYSYSASFAVALSGRPIHAIHRIWADGKLLRGAAGDWKSETSYRLYRGDEGQAADPLIAAAEGAGGTPAYRGLAYVVFEDMQLADFGNRIPSLTFEVEADEGAVPLDVIAADLSGGAIGGDTSTALGGYAAGGDSVRGAIEMLSRALPIWIGDDGHRLRLQDGLPATVMLPDEALGARVGDSRVAQRMIDREATGTVPDEVTVTYYEPARDYQAGLQRARRAGPGRRVETIELAAAMEAGAAKAVAERRLADGWAKRLTARVAVPWRWLDLRPGDMLALAGDRPRRIGGWTLEGMILTLELRGVTGPAAVMPQAEHGRVTGEPDALHGPTSIALVDLPPLDDGVTTPRLWLAAAGVSPGWRRATVLVSSDEGASWQDAGPTASPAVMGRTLTLLPAGDSTTFDDTASVDVVLLNATMALLSRDDDALVNGANAAMIGDELIQFGRAELLGPGRWRLSRLLRGRRGTEARMGGHAIGDAFILVEPDSLLPIEIPPARIGATLHVIASGIADATGVEAHRIVSGRALLPPAPVHLRASVPAGGGLRFDWTRRSRIGWTWSDGGDVPLGEETERHRVTIQPDVGLSRTIETTSAGYDYDPGQISSDGAAGATMFVVTVRQLGANGASPDALIGRYTAKGEAA